MGKAETARPDQLCQAWQDGENCFLDQQDCNQNGHDRRTREADGLTQWAIRGIVEIMLSRRGETGIELQCFHDRRRCRCGDWLVMDMGLRDVGYPEERKDKQRRDNAAAQCGSTLSRKAAPRKRYDPHKIRPLSQTMINKLLKGTQTLEFVCRFGRKSAALFDKPAVNGPLIYLI